MIFAATIGRGIRWAGLRFARWIYVGKTLTMVDRMNMPVETFRISAVEAEAHRLVLVSMSAPRASARDRNGRIRFSGSGRRTFAIEEVTYDKDRRGWIVRQ